MKRYLIALRNLLIGFKQYTINDNFNLHPTTNIEGEGP